MFSYHLLATILVILATAKTSAVCGTELTCTRIGLCKDGNALPQCIPSIEPSSIPVNQKSPISKGDFWFAIDIGSGDIRGNAEELIGTCGNLYHAARVRSLASRQYHFSNSLSPALSFISLTVRFSIICCQMASRSTVPTLSKHYYLVLSISLQCRTVER